MLNFNELSDKEFNEILESLELLAMTDDELDAYAQAHSEPVDEYAELEADYASNAPCDCSGYCVGTTCPHYWRCQWRG